MTSYLRIRASNSQNYSNKKVALVGKIVNNPSQKLVIDCEDVNNITVQFIKQTDTSKLKTDDIIEVRGEIVGNMILAEDFSAYSQSFKLSTYNQALDHMQMC